MRDKRRQKLKINQSFRNWKGNSLRARHRSATETRLLRSYLLAIQIYRLSATHFSSLRLNNTKTRLLKVMGSGARFSAFIYSRQDNRGMATSQRADSRLRAHKECSLDFPVWIQLIKVGVNLKVAIQSGEA